MRDRTERPRVALDHPTSVTGNEHKPRQRKRIPVDLPYNPLEYPDKPGYHRHIFNDKQGRLERALRGGYQFVTKTMLKEEGYDWDPILSQKGEVDDKVSWLVGQEDNGAPIRGYLMEIPQAWYDEDQRTREGKTLAIIKESLRQGQSEMNPGQDELYPAGPGVKFGKDL